MNANRRGALVVTMGEPAGIGGEVALKAWRILASSGPAFAVIDDPNRLSLLADLAGIDGQVRPIDSLEAVSSTFSDALPVLPLTSPVETRPGRPDPATAKAVLEAIDRAIDLTMTGEATAMVTNPIHKATMYKGGFEYPGHTEYLSKKGGYPGQDAMMLAIDGLRVVPVTSHIPLADVSAKLNKELIVEKARLTVTTLMRDFRIARPRLAVAALNPHAGESGALGREEIDILSPAVAALRSEGWDVGDPRPADSLFHEGARANYDAVLCMYHDQALIPLKTLDFDGGVNITMGLPFIRTSPDHGTALDIAGSGAASPTSLVAAIRMAAQMAANRAIEKDG